MKNRKLFIPIFIVVITGLIIGSFYDLEISQHFYFKRNIPALFFTSIGSIVAYSGLTITGTYAFLYGKNKIQNKWLKVCYFAVAIGYVLFYIYVTLDDFSNKDAWDLSPLLKYLVGAPIILVCAGLGIYLGTILYKNDSTGVGLRAAITIAVMLMVPYAIVTLVKPFFGRPRFRWLESQGLIETEFRNWWERNVDKNNLISIYNAPKSEFKSFPSGHGMNSAIPISTLAYIPLLYKPLLKKQGLLMYIGFGFNIIVSVSRISLGAHFLSDVCFGSLISILTFYIANEVFLNCVLKKEENKMEH